MGPVEVDPSKGNASAVMIGRIKRVSARARVSDRLQRFMDVNQLDEDCRDQLRALDPHEQQEVARSLAVAEIHLHCDEGARRARRNASPGMR